MSLLDSLVLGVHLVGASIWVGGSIALAVTTAALARHHRSEPEAAVPLVAAVARSMSWVMWPALGITILTGLYNLSWYLPPGTSLGAEPVLEAKVLLVGLVLLTSGLHTFVIGPRLRRRREAGASPASLAPWRRANLLLALLSMVATFGVVLLAAFLGGP